MAKKNYEKKEVNDVLDKAIISDGAANEVVEVVEETVVEEPLLEESLALDMDKLSADLEEIKKEIFEEKPKKEEKVDVEKPKENKTFVNHIFGLMWNGQEYDY